MIRVCCDSGSQLGPFLAGRHRIGVVPLTVTIDGSSYLEGIDLDADGFWAMFDGGRTPVVGTAAPSPGQFIEAYRDLIAEGASEIVSVHTGSAISATFDAARLASKQVDVPVHLVDTGSASFVVGALDLPRAGGRLASDTDEQPGAVPVMRLAHGEMSVVDHAGTIDEAAAKMAAEILATGDRLRVGLSIADPGARPIVDALRSRLAAAPAHLEVLEYRVGPSVGAHTGPGTAGAVYHPI